ncbi:MAG: DUF2793 domain-containing protein [Holosporales bacterium]
MPSTPRLLFPYIATGQAQKEVTHADTLNRLDALVQATAEDKDLTAPPTSPVEGAAYLIMSATPTGAWAGQSGRLAHYLAAAWRFYAPFAGMRVWVKDEARMYVYSGTAWVMPMPQVPSYTVATLPVAVPAGSLAFVSNEVGGAVLAFSDGTSWRRVTDRLVVA